MSSSGISWAICKSAPCFRQITTPTPHHSVFTSRMPYLPPKQQHQSTEGKDSYRNTYLEFLNWWMGFSMAGIPEILSLLEKSVYLCRNGSLESDNVVNIESFPRGLVKRRHGTECPAEALTQSDPQLITVCQRPPLPRHLHTHQANSALYPIWDNVSHFSSRPKSDT